MGLIRKEQLRSYPSDKVVWFDISGNDTTGDGSWLKPLRYAQTAITKIKTDHPTRSATDQYTAAAVSGYVSYETWDLTSSADWINIYAPDVTFIDQEVATAVNFRIGANNIVTVREAKRVDYVGTVITKENAGSSVLNAQYIKSAISTGGGLLLREGTLYINCKEFTTINATDTLVTIDPAYTNQKLYLNADYLYGKIYITNTTGIYHLNSLQGTNDFEINASGKLRAFIARWTGNVKNSGALSEVYIITEERLSAYSGDTGNSDTAKIVITETSKLKELSVPLDYDTNYQSGRSKQIATAGTGRLTFVIPSHIKKIEEIWVRGYISAGASGSGKDIDLTINAGTLNEPYNQHTASDTTATYDFTGRTNLLTEIFDLKTLLSSLAGGDTALLTIVHNVIGGNIDYMDVMIKYYY